MYVTNAFGLSSKLGEFRHDLLLHGPDIAVVTETKFTPEKISQAEVTFPGYCAPIRKDRSAHGGGVAVWIKSSLAFKHLDVIDTGELEVIWLSVQTANQGSMVLCAAYRPGSAAETDIQLLEHIDTVLSSNQLKYSNIIITGDFNVHNQSWLGSCKTTRAGEAAEDLCSLHGLDQHIHEPTRGANTLDLLMSDFPGPVNVNILPPLGKSDHVVIVAELKHAVSREPRVKRTVWRYAQADWDRLNHFFRSQDWETVLSADVDLSTSRMTAVILAGMERFIPSRVLSSRPSDPPWWTPECTTAIQRKQKAWKRHRSMPDDPIGREQYKDACHLSSATLYRARHEHMQSAATKLASGSLSNRDWWCQIKRAGGHSRGGDIPVLCDPSGMEHTTNKDKANCFGQFFSQKCHVSNDFAPDTPLPPVISHTNSKLLNVRFRASQVQRELKRLVANKATGPDCIPARVLKQCASSLASPLARLFTLSFREGVVPQQWKQATVVPVHKRSSKSTVSNYRPISLLPIISKVMEAIINRRMVNFLEHHKCFSDNQFGFRKNIGSADLLTQLSHQFSHTAGQGGAVRVLAVDIAGAFDRVSHRGVLHKLKCMGIDGSLLVWLRHYLHNRQMSAVVGGSTSSSYPISAGVPQGSILGPTLFLAYINDAEDHLPPNLRLAVYADDTTLYQCISSPANISTASKELQDGVDALAKWGAQWCVSFEPTKSQSLVISHHRPPWHLPEISFDGHHVRTTPELKLLGVTFDQHLLFTKHLRQTALRAKQRLHFLKKASPLLDTRGQTTVYKGFVRPILEYAPLAWMGACDTALDMLDAVQHRALKIFDRPVLLQSLAARRKVAALCYLYKLHYLPGPPALLAIKPSPATPPLYTSTRRQSTLKHQFQLDSTLPNRNSIRRGFPGCVLADWNRLPPDLLEEKPSPKHMQRFKCCVNRFLLHDDWVWATDHL